MRADRKSRRRRRRRPPSPCFPGTSASPITFGASRSESNRTTWADLFIDDPENAWYRVPGRKTAGAAALNPLPPSVARALVAWRRVNESEIVFPGRSAQTKGKQVKRREAIFRKIRQRTSIEAYAAAHPELAQADVRARAKAEGWPGGVKLSTKDMRDYYATMVDTDDARVLKELMRHESLATTTQYVRRRGELMRDAVKNLGVNFGDTPLLENGRTKSTFGGNQHVTREEWVGNEQETKH